MDRSIALGPLSLAAWIALSSCGTSSPPPAPELASASSPSSSSPEAANQPDRPPPVLDALRDGSASVRSVDWQRYFGVPPDHPDNSPDAPGKPLHRKGCFLGLDVTTGVWTRNDPEPCAERFRPFSTYKIPHALIGLETGELADASTVIEWDREKYPAESWWPAAWQGRHDLRSAMTHSVVPYFRTLAGRIGAERMEKYLDAFAYGNRTIGDGLDHFWLDGDLAISAEEQVGFLAALHQGRLPVSSRSRDIVLDILIRERGPGHVLRAKTGTGRLPDGSALGWYVGSVETSGGLYLFALNIRGEDYSDIPRKERIATSEAILTDLGVLPRDRASR